MKITWKCKECWNEQTIDDSWTRSVRFKRSWRKLPCPKCKKIAWHIKFDTNSDYHYAKEIGIHKHFEGGPDQ